MSTNCYNSVSYLLLREASSFETKKELFVHPRCLFNTVFHPVFMKREVETSDWEYTVVLVSEVPMLFNQAKFKFI